MMDDTTAILTDKDFDELLRFHHVRRLDGERLTWADPKGYLLLLAYAGNLRADNAALRLGIEQSHSSCDEWKIAAIDEKIRCRAAEKDNAALRAEVERLTKERDISRQKFWEAEDDRDDFENTVRKLVSDIEDGHAVETALRARLALADELMESAADLEIMLHEVRVGNWICAKSAKTVQWYLDAEDAERAYRVALSAYRASAAPSAGGDAGWEETK